VSCPKNSSPTLYKTSGRRRPARTAARPRPALASLDAELVASQQRPAPQPKSFAELGLPASVVEVLDQRGIREPSEIQARAVPDALGGRDILGRAQTGSGKTLAFGLPMLTRLHTSGQKRTARAPRGLVLVPTRELAGQVADALEPVAQVLGLRVSTVFGGTSIGRQIEKLQRGVDLVVATPGRLLDLMEREAARLDTVEIAVIDEADHLADLGFLPSVTRILDATPSGRQCMLFSATLDHGVDRLVARYLGRPAIHAVTSASAPVESMDHRVFLLDRDDKIEIAAEIAARPARTLFFVRTKHGADRLARQLAQRGLEAAAIHGNLNQNQRTRALDAFASGRTRVLVATDVAARGLHIDDLDLVVHFDPPSDHKHYLHRSGRTARAGASGTVVSLVEAHQARDVAHMHASASVRPDVTTVQAGHPAVRAITASGEPITTPPRHVPPTPEDRRAQRSANVRGRSKRGHAQRSVTSPDRSSFRSK
jgi:superfamily II DNA/RNA helicase